MSRTIAVILIIIPCCYFYALNYSSIVQKEPELFITLSWITIILTLALGYVDNSDKKRYFHPYAIVSLITILMIFAYFCGVKSGEDKERWHNMTPQEKKDYMELMKSIGD